MKTMFAAPENNAKKRFQKPNILRKRSKPPTKLSIPAHESLSAKHLVSASTVQEPKLSVFKQCLNKNTQSVQRLCKPEDYCVSNKELCLGELYQIDGNLETDASLAVTCDVLTNNNEENVFETTINVESFLNNSEMEQMVTQADIENELGNRVKHEWCLDFINDAQEIIIEDIDGSHLGSLRLASPAAAPEPARAGSRAAPAQNITLEYMNCAMNFKCSMPNCSKRFRSQAALSKHEGTHTKVAKTSNKAERSVVIECPVRKVLSSGEEQQCGVRCTNKKDIVNHLNEAHSPEDAMYICAECNRRFYWAAGLRAHSRTHQRGGGGAGGAGGEWACGWAGCGRAFRQPCRLREHMRAHTGDRPYPCTHPNCGWSFRTASKLLRHARRHTGERRHACERCGRAFRRREHLRDHAARHRATKHACMHAGCLKKFNSVEALKRHMGKVHNEDLTATPQPSPSAPAHERDSPLEDSFMVNLNSEVLSASTLAEVKPPALTDILPAAHSQATAGTGTTLLIRAGARVMSQTETGIVSQAEEMGRASQAEPGVGIGAVGIAAVGIGGVGIAGVGVGGVGIEGVGVDSPRAARTHCTWPFAPRTAGFEDATHQFDLEDDITVEISERAEAESNIYTIRSDLFLHGNILNNEDSEQMGGASAVEVDAADEGARGAAGEGGLLDHPTSELMQEELMYTDAAVDESSFRVFLLSEELS